MATVINGRRRRATDDHGAHRRARPTRITITQSGGDGGLAGLVYPPSGTGLTQVQEALDARVLIDGVLATSTTNTVSGAIAGVDVTLKAVNDRRRDDAAHGRLRPRRPRARRSTSSSRATTYSSTALKSVTSYNVETEQGGPLFGDGGVRNIVDQLRRELTTNVAGLSADVRHAGEARHQRRSSNGKLSVDSADLDAAFNGNFDAVGELFATDDSRRRRQARRAARAVPRPQGVFDSRTASLKSSIESINDRREALTERLDGAADALHATVQRPRRRCCRSCRARAIS